MKTVEQRSPVQYISPRRQSKVREGSPIQSKSRSSWSFPTELIYNIHIRRMQILAGSFTYLVTTAVSSISIFRNTSSLSVLTAF